jgi:hypothetical protein
LVSFEVVMNKFTIDHRYNHIGVSQKYWHLLGEIGEWCYNSDNGKFEVYATGIVYKREQDLTAFLLRWE